MTNCAIFIQHTALLFGQMRENLTKRCPDFFRFLEMEKWKKVEGEALPFHHVQVSLSWYMYSLLHSHQIVLHPSLKPSRKYLNPETWRQY